MTSINTGLVSMQCYSSAVSFSNFQSAADLFNLFIGKTWECPRNASGAAVGIRWGHGGLVYYLRCSTVVSVPELERCILKKHRS